MPRTLFDLTTDHLIDAFPCARIANLRRYWPEVRNALVEAHLDDPVMVSYAFGTIAAETAGFIPLREYPSKYNTIKTPFDRYEGRRDLGNTHPGDGYRFPGRGFIQLTGRDNYRRYGQRLGVDLIRHPELANDSRIAAQLLAIFISDCKPDIAYAIQRGNFARARKLVNGGTHGMDRFLFSFNVIRRILRGDA